MAKRLGVSGVILAWALVLLPPQPPGAEDKPRIAVLNLETRDSPEQAEGIAEELRSAFVKSGQYTVVDRTLTNRIAKEWETQQSGLTDGDKALKVGKLYNVQSIVTGKLSKFPDGGWQVSGVMLDAQSGITQRAETVRHRGDFFSLLDQRVPALARALLGRGPNEGPTPASASVAVAAVAVPGAELQGMWRSAAPLTPPRQEHAAVALNGKIYVIGGQSQEGATAWISVYDPGSNTWTRLAPTLPTPRRYPVAVALEGRIYVIGGMVDNKPSGAVEAFDPATGAWQSLAPLPTPRWQAAAAEVGGRIFVFGGRTDRNEFSAAVDVFDPRANTWSGRGQAPRKVAGWAAVTMGNLIYAVGGESKDVGAGFLSLKSGEDALLEYDPAGDRWAFKSPTPVARIGPTAVVVGPKIYVFGGMVGSSLMRSQSKHYDVFDTVTGKWLGTQPMPHGRSNHAAAYAGGRIYVIAGAGDAGPTMDELR